MAKDSALRIEIGRSFHQLGTVQEKDFIYHLIAAVFYLSASVILAYITIFFKNSTAPYDQYYKIDIAAVVFSYVATLLYFIHCILSAVRWKSF